MRRYEEDPKKAPLDTLKCKIPPFIGDGDVKPYLKWEMKVDQVLKCFNYNDYMKVRMVTYKFSKYALVWWNQYIKEHIDTWLDLRREMRTRFVPTSYARDLYSKLQRMYQGSKSVEECHKDMEVALMRANVLEFNEAIMAPFLHVKSQQRRHLALKRTYPNNSSSWKSKEREQERPRKDKSPKKGSSPIIRPEGRKYTTEP
ncbi:hypothetical protein CR513_21721, partial [Mucuna pruriens]